ncbi:Ribosomal RNA-processing protein 15 [Arabidopsis suecica]|uniref:Ribosomal RNA-processing protein 15 n=1 Tax=Arabidopsis suecica TaxID=45249 RepID=A0A8T1XR28_ARASU|nr:Ribosomal RNA-processing protein 15 [Arabidopsis suecica]
MSTGEEGHMAMADRGSRKRRFGVKKGTKAARNKKLKSKPSSSDRFKVTMKNQKLFQKRARDYNSDEEEEEDESKKQPEVTIREKIFSDANMGPNYEEIEEEDGEDNDENSDGEDHGEIESGITKFATDGCNAFKIAFKAIMKKTKGDDTLGPVLSAHKHLIGEKLAEEEAEKKAKGQARKAKHLIAEKGHVKPESYLDSHEKILIGVATKGVVKLFNAVNKAQHAQKGLNPSRSKDAKVLKKRRKEAFFSELGKTKTDPKAQKSEEEAPAWAPLRDNYMLANPKLKDWDKNQETKEGDDFAAMSGDESYED